MDQIDLQILDCLQNDATVSVSEIAKQVGLSTSPCWNLGKGRKSFGNFQNQENSNLPVTYPVTTKREWSETSQSINELGYTSPKGYTLNPRRIKIKNFLFIGCLVFTMLSQGVHAQSLLHPSDSRVVSQGSLIYKQYCASCHGKNHEGERNWRSRLPDGTLPAPPHDETGHTWHHSDKILFDITKKGTEKIVGGNYKSKMPGFEKILTDSQIVAVLSYIKSRWSENVRRRHDRINKRSLESK